MKSETITTTVLKADEGKILTDGSVYGKIIYLAKDRNAEEFHEITEAEYEEIQSKLEAEMDEVI